MKKEYASPSLIALTLATAESILTASEENSDISIGFDTLWGV